MLRYPIWLKWDSDVSQQEKYIRNLQSYGGIFWLHWRIYKYKSIKQNNIEVTPVMGLVISIGVFSLYIMVQ